MRLRLPEVLAVAVVTTVAVAACGGDDAPPSDAGTADVVESYFCIDDGTRPDGGAGQPDANPCGQVVTNPADCPDGCTPVG